MSGWGVARLALPRRQLTRPTRRDALNERLLCALNDSGRVYLTRTRVRGRYVIRFAIGQRTTTREHVQRARRLIRETARGLAAADRAATH